MHLIKCGILLSAATKTCLSHFFKPAFVLFFVAQQTHKPLAAAVPPVVLMSWCFSPLTLKLTANNPTAGRKQSSVLWMFPSVEVSFPPQHLSFTCFNHRVFLMWCVAVPPSSYPAPPVSSPCACWEISRRSSVFFFPAGGSVTKQQNQCAGLVSSV